MLRTLTGEKVYLRALEMEDLDFLFEVENDEEFWEVSATSVPFSRYVLKQYLQNAHRDIFEIKQLRLVICQKNDVPVGFIDLYDFEPRHSRAAVGIVIKNKNDRNKGFGLEALGLLARYCFVHLNLHQIYANISSENLLSKILFEKAGFIKTGVKLDWLKKDEGFEDEVTYQLIKKHVH